MTYLFLVKKKSVVNSPILKDVLTCLFSACLLFVIVATCLSVGINEVGNEVGDKVGNKLDDKASEVYIF